jgi:peptidoglycan hydrolase-like protein with peptidoglycan-binding domain
MNKIILTTLISSALLSFSFAQSTVSNFDWFNPSFSNTANTTVNLTGNQSGTQVIIPNTNNVQTVNNQNNNISTQQVQIPQNVLVAIDAVKVKYNLNQAQVTALNQVARSYQYTLITSPQTQPQAQISNVRDLAATDCLSSRLTGQAVDDAVNKIELASLDTTQKSIIYNRYISLLDENALQVPTFSSSASCEDEYVGGSNQGSTNQNSTFQVNLNGVISDQNIASECLILTHFMEFGSRDSQVFPLQNFLMENGYLEMYPTGFFGRNTEFAVKEWQKRHGIDVRGWVGPNTRGSIAGLTCKTQAAYDKAFKGEIVKKYVAPAKKVLSKTPVSQPTKTIVIETTTEDNFKPVTFSNTNSGNNLSSLGATFFTKRSPVNTLYFTYKANTTLDDVYMCVSKNGSNKCETSGNFVEVKQKYEPGSIDTINNNTKWIFNVYYNPDTWGTEGGNIYIRNGIGNISEVYSVKVANTL